MGFAGCTGKTLARRTYQKGNVFQKGRKRSDAWLPNEPAYMQFWEDVPGQETRRRKHLAVGIYSTRTKAERAAAEKLEQLGINSAQTFIESTSNITFQQQAEIWLKSLANRKRNPLEQTAIDTHGDTPSTSGCTRFSVTSSLRISTTLP